METREVLIIGGGIIGMAIALELQQRGVKPTILRRNFAEAAAHAAAGMLAPQAEGISDGAMWDLCLQSRSMYGDWAMKLENLSGRSVGYWPCGILAPAYDRTEMPHDGESWLEAEQLRSIQPGLSDAVSGGWWFPQDGQVDNRKLAQALQLALQEGGVEIQDGVEVQAIVRDASGVQYLQTTAGDWRSQHYILTTGAWSQALLAVPVTPRKGQMLSVQVPDPTNLPLQTVLFGSDIYIVPRQDGRIILGATSENVGFEPGNTAGGIKQLLQNAIRLFPAMRDYQITETWWGYRPATPDELPILGESPIANLTLAIGHYRNGILLTPITGKLIADYVVNGKGEDLLNAFHYSRFDQNPTKPW
jgi:glycine oxidase